MTIEGALARVPLVASDVGGIGEGMQTRSTRCCSRVATQGRGDGLARTLSEREQTAARVARAHNERNFRLGPYLDSRSASCSTPWTPSEPPQGHAHRRRSIARRRALDQSNMLSLSS